MYAETSFVLAVMVFTFALASWKLKSPELSMVITAVVGALAGDGLVGLFEELAAVIERVTQEGKEDAKHVGRGLGVRPFDLDGLGREGLGDLFGVGGGAGGFVDDVACLAA